MQIRGAECGILPVMLIFGENNNPEIISNYRDHWNVFIGSEAFDLIHEITQYDLQAFIEDQDAVDDYMDEITGSLGEMRANTFDS